MNTQELIANIGKEHALAVAEWLEFTIQEFRDDRPEDESTAEYLENLTDYLRLHAASEFVETHQGTSANEMAAENHANQGKNRMSAGSQLKNTDIMDL